MQINTLLRAAQANQTGPAVLMSTLNRQFVVQGRTQQGPGAAEVEIDVSNDGTAWTHAISLRVTFGADINSNAETIDAAWAYARARVTSITGQGAALDCYALETVADASAAGKGAGATSGGSSPLMIGPASGDTTGATDATRVNSLLETARLAGGGMVIGQAGETYYINTSIVVGSKTTLDMTGCVILPASGYNGIMLENYAARTVINSTGVVVVSSGGTQLTFPSSSDPGLLALNALPNNGRGAIFDVPMTIPTSIGNAAVRFVGTVNGINVAGRVCTFTRPTPAAIGSYTAWRLYQRDALITVRGGIWDRGANGTSSDVFTNHASVFRHLDGLLLENMTFKSTGLAGRYAVLIMSISAVLIRNMYWGDQPGVGNWASNVPGYFRDGVHIVGPAKQIVLKDFYGFPGDDMAAVTCADFPGISDDYWGDVEDLTIENMHASNAGQCSVKLLGGPQANLRRIRVSKLTGPSNSLAGAVSIGDDNRFPQIMDTLADDIVVEQVMCTAQSNRALVTINGLYNRKITIRDCIWNNAASTSSGAIVLGNNPGGAGNIPTTVTDLTVENFGIKAINAVTNVVDVITGSTTESLRVSNWSWTGNANRKAYERIGGAGAINYLEIGDISPQLYHPRVLNNWYNPTDMPTAGIVFPALTQDKLYVTLPRIATERMTISQLAISTSVVGGAGSVARGGVYIVTGADPYKVTLGSAWAILVTGAEGTVATDALTGARTITLGTPAVILPGQAYCIGVVHQIAAPAVQRANTAPDRCITPWGNTFGNAGLRVVSATGVTGALPATFTPSAFENVIGNGTDHGVMFLRSA